MKTAFVIAGLVVASLGWADPGVTERLERPDGSTVVGRVMGSRDSGVRFVPKDGSDPFDLGKTGTVRFEPSGSIRPGAIPPFHVVVGRDQRISGRLASFDNATIRLEDGPGGRSVTIQKSGALALMQRSGEVQVLQDGFEKLDAGRWSSVGSPEISTALKLVGDRALKLPVGGSALTCRIPDPVGRGRLEVAFYDDGRIAPREQTFVDLLFRGERGLESIRAVLGWAEESLAVESPEGPALAVQRLNRKTGWRRLGVRFGPDRTEVSVDGDELAHGKGPGGPLVEIRLATHTVGSAPISSPKELAATFDDLRVVRFAEPTGEMEADPTQDEIRLVSGDQTFGGVSKADAERIMLKIEGRDISYPWSEVSGIYLTRLAVPSKPVTGLMARLEWRSAPGNDPRDVDAVEGVIVDASNDVVQVETPQAGTLEIPRDRMRLLRVIGLVTRIVIDPYAHHLGDDVSEAPEHLDPPQPEGGILERSFELTAAPTLGARLVIDAVQVVGEAQGLRYSNKIRDGELLTNLYVNGKKIDYLNRYITTNNETPETVRVPIPAGLLKAGKNVLRLEQIGLKNDPTYLDDLGVVGLAIELDTPPPQSGRQD